MEYALDYGRLLQQLPSDVSYKQIQQVLIIFLVKAQMDGCKREDAIGLATAMLHAEITKVAMELPVSLVNEIFGDH